MKGKKCKKCGMTFPLGPAPIMGHDCILYLKTEVERLKRQRNLALEGAGLSPDCLRCVSGVCSAHQPAIGRVQIAEARTCALLQWMEKAADLISTAIPDASAWDSEGGLADQIDSRSD